MESRPGRCEEIISGLYMRGPENPPAAITKRPAPPTTPLTPRELEVLALVARGLTAASIGLRLQMSSTTVRTHLEHIYKKTGQRDRLLAVNYARQLGCFPKAKGAMCSRVSVETTHSAIFAATIYLRDTCVPRVYAAMPSQMMRPSLAYICTSARYA